MQVKDPRYDYHITVSVHLIIENQNHQILMGKRPITWEWAPGRWGLIGGKVYAHETISETVKRKTKQELGFELTSSGFYEIKQLIFRPNQRFSP